MRRLWIAFTLVMFVSFLVLGWVGTRIYDEMPPIPDRVVTTTGEEVIGLGDIEKGQNVWQTLGGMQVGSRLVCRLSPSRSHVHSESMGSR
jgi:nitric oxide reductase subunit B